MPRRSRRQAHGVNAAPFAKTSNGAAPRTLNSERRTSNAEGRWTSASYAPRAGTALRRSALNVRRSALRRCAAPLPSLAFEHWLEQPSCGIFPVVAQGPFAAGVTEAAPEVGFADEFLERGSELRGVVRRDEQARFTVANRVADAAHGVRDDRQAVCGGLEINQPETLHARTVGNARHGKDVRAVVHPVEFVIRQVAEETDGEITFRRGLAQLLLVTRFVPATDHPVLHATPEAGRQGLQRLQGDELALAGMQPANGEHDD